MFFPHFSLIFFGFGMAIPSSKFEFFPSVACFLPSPLLWHHTGEFINLLSLFLCSQGMFFPHYSLIFFGFGAAFPPSKFEFFPLCSPFCWNSPPYGLLPYLPPVPSKYLACSGGFLFAHRLDFFHSWLTFQFL